MAATRSGGSGSKLRWEWQQLDQVGAAVTSGGSGRENRWEWQQLDQVRVATSRLGREIMDLLHPNIRIIDRYVCTYCRLEGNPQIPSVSERTSTYVRMYTGTYIRRVHCKRMNSK